MHLPFFPPQHFKKYFKLLSLSEDYETKRKDCCGNSWSKEDDNYMKSSYIHTQDNGCVRELNH